MNQAGSRVGARCWSGVRVCQAVRRSQACPPSTSLTSSTTPAFDANPTRRLPCFEVDCPSLAQQQEKGRTQ